MYILRLVTHISWRIEWNYAPDMSWMVDPSIVTSYEPRGLRLCLGAIKTFDTRLIIGDTTKGAELSSINSLTGGTARAVICSA